MGVMQAASGAPVEAPAAAPAKPAMDERAVERETPAQPAPAPEPEPEPEPAAAPVAEVKPQPEQPAAVAAPAVTAVAGDDIQKIAEISAGKL